RVLRSACFDPGFTAVAGVSVRTVDLLTTTLLVVAIVLGVRIVGAILMVSLLVAPAVAARQLSPYLSRVIPLSGAIGAAAGCLGAVGASRAEVPTGPAIVILVVAAATLSTLLAPHRGVLTRAWRRRRDAEMARAS
ncbi:MAG: metal ABC transporter permease, partial [Pseudonocardiaceae bacterium]